MFVLNHVLVETESKKNNILIQYICCKKNGALFGQPQVLKPTEPTEYIWPKHSINNCIRNKGNRVGTMN